MKNHNINHEKLNLINNNINIKSSENNYFRILDTSTNQILKIPEKEFLYSVVASEMPALFEPEALKSQAVASYTYFCKKRQENINKKYDFEINTEKSLNYITEQELRKKWGDNYDNYYLRFSFEGTESFTIPYENIIHLKRFYQSDQIFGGSNSSGDQEALLKTIEINENVLQGIDNALKSSMQIKGLLKMSAMLSDTDKNKQLESFNEILTSSQFLTGKLKTFLLLSILSIISLNSFFKATCFNP